MSKKSGDGQMPKEPAAKKQITLEEAFGQIEDIISRMEDQEVTLDESFRLYQEGIEKLKHCGQMLDEVEKKMQILNSRGELEDF